MFIIQIEISYQTQLKNAQMDIGEIIENKYDSVDSCKIKSKNNRCHQNNVDV